MGSSDEIKLQVLVCTIGEEGIQRVCSTPRPRVPGVEYIICWQQPNNPLSIPPALKARSDIRIVIHHTRGLSCNRNRAMNESDAPFCLIGDDDVEYAAEGLNALIEAFALHPHADIICTRYTCNGAYVKPYGLEPFTLDNAPKGWYPTSFEIAYRRESPAGETRFCEQFGLGAPLFRAGEEDIWLYDSMRTGAQAICLPIDIGKHDRPTTGERHAAEAWFVMTHGAVMSHIHPRSWIARCMVHSVRQRIWYASRYMLLCLKGAWYAHRKRLFQTTGQVSSSKTKV